MDASEREAESAGGGIRLVKAKDREEMRKHLADLNALGKQGYSYIARAEHGELRAYKSMPAKQINF